MPAPRWARVFVPVIFFSILIGCCAFWGVMPDRRPTFPIGGGLAGSGAGGGGVCSLLRLFRLLFWVGVIGFWLFGPGSWAKADITNGPTVAFPLVTSGTTASGGSFSSRWYIPDPSNVFCPSGSIAVSASMKLSSNPADYAPPALPIPGGTVSYPPTCYTGSMYSYYFSNITASAAYGLSGTFQCPPGSDYDNSSGNCLTDLTNTSDTVNGWAWGFGVVFICWLFGFLIGHAARVLDDLADA